MEILDFATIQEDPYVNSYGSSSSLASSKKEFISNNIGLCIDCIMSTNEILRYPKLSTLKCACRQSEFLGSRSLRPGRNAHALCCARQHQAKFWTWSLWYGLSYGRPYTENASTSETQKGPYKDYRRSKRRLYGFPC